MKEPHPVLWPYLAALYLRGKPRRFDLEDQLKHDIRQRFGDVDERWQEFRRRNLFLPWPQDLVAADILEELERLRPLCWLRPPYGADPTSRLVEGWQLWAEGGSLLTTDDRLR